MWPGRASIGRRARTIRPSPTARRPSGSTRSDAVAYCNRGFSYRRKGKNDEAIRRLHGRPPARPEGCRCLLQPGLLLPPASEYDKAIADLTEAIRLNPKHAEAYMFRGDTYQKKGNFDQAVADFTAAIRLEPEQCHGV